jgi:hypothetical protein
MAKYHCPPPPLGCGGTNVVAAYYHNCPAHGHKYWFVYQPEELGGRPAPSPCPDGLTACQIEQGQKPEDHAHGCPPGGIEALTALCYDCGTLDRFFVPTLP